MQIVGFPMERLIYNKYMYCIQQKGQYTIWAASWENQQCGFRTGLTQTGLYKHRRWLETWNFGFRKKRNCTIRVAKTKALISFAVTSKLICVFVFAYADCWFFHEAAHMYSVLKKFWIINQQTFICLFELRFNVPVKIFSVMLRRSHRFLGINR